jgi:hypothetical protein
MGAETYTESLVIEHGSSLQGAQAQLSADQRQQKYDDLVNNPRALEMAKFTDAMSAETSGDAYATDSIFNAKKPVVETAESDHSETKKALGYYALRASERALDYEFKLDRHQEVGVKIVALSQRHQRDPRYTSPVRRAGRTLLGKRTADAADATFLDTLQADRVEAIKTSGYDPDTASDLQWGIITEKQLLRDKLDLVRQELATFDEEQQLTLDSLFGGTDTMPQFLKGQKPKNVSWAVWLSNNQSGANDEQLLNVLDWHANYIERMNNSSEGEHEVLKVKEEYKRAITEQIAHGNLPSSVQGRLTRIDAIPVKVKSMFAMAYDRNYGQHHKGAKEVYVANLNNQAIINHEFNHALFGDINANDPLGMRWLNEAMTEHTAQVLSSRREADNFMPAANEYYALERALVHVLIHNSNGELATDDFMAAYTGKEPYDALEAKVAKAYGGQDILGEVSGAINTMYAEAIYNSSNVNEILAKTGSSEPAILTKWIMQVHQQA